MGLSTTSFYRLVRSAKVHTEVTEVMAGFATPVTPTSARRARIPGS